MHSLLKRQIKKNFGNPDKIPSSVENFISEVGQSYSQFDEDRAMLERAMQISSQELSDINSAMRHMLQAWPDTIFRLKKDGTIVECVNHNPDDLLFPIHQLIGRKIQNTPDNLAKNIFSQKLANLSQKQSLLTFEYSIGINGLKKHFEARMTKISDDQIMLIIRNITEKIQSEENLKKSFSLLRATLESTADGILVVDQTGQVADFNDKFIEMWKIPKEIIAAKDDNRTLQYVLDQLKNPGSFLLKVKELYSNPTATSFDILEFKDNRVFERYSQAQYMGDHVVGRVWSFRDITEQKKLQAIVHQSEKMSAVGQLAGGVAHEINNPLGVILGFAQSAKSRLDEKNPLMTPLNHIEREALRCKTLVQNLLTFSRVSSVEKMTAININDAIEDAFSLIMAQSKFNTIELEKSLEPNLPSIRGNKTQIQQIVINLCNNAIDAMGNNGTLTVRTSLLRKNGCDWAVLEVIDTGHGIPLDIQKKIFDPFFTTKEVGKGTGLGLSLVYEIVQKHKGLIELRSQEGKGTTFIVSFPFNSDEKNETPG